jgi:hypothetical protein
MLAGRMYQKQLLSFVGHNKRTPPTMTLQVNFQTTRTELDDELMIQLSNGRNGT